MTAHAVPLAVLGAIAAALSGCCQRDSHPPRAASLAARDLPAVDQAGPSVPGTIVVDFRDGTTKGQFDAWEKDWGIDLEFNSVEGEESGVTLATGVDGVDEVLARLRQNPEVEAAEPLFVYEASFVPND